MLSKLVLLGCFAFLLQNGNSLAIDKVEKDGDVNVKVEKDSKVDVEVAKVRSDPREELIKEAIKNFVDMVELYNLNVSLVGSHESHYATGDKRKQQMGISIKMPVNDVFLTEPTLDDNKQQDYIKHFKKYAEPLAIKTRVIKIENGESQVADEQSVAETRNIHSDNYELLTQYHKGKQGYVFPKNESHLIINNFIIKDPNDTIKYMKLVSGEITVTVKEVTPGFSKKILKEAKRFIPMLFVSITDNDVLCRELGDHLKEKFVGRFQIMMGVDHFSNSDRTYANLNVAGTNIVILLDDLF